MWRSFRFISLAVAAFAGAASAETSRYARDTVDVNVPAVVLVDQNGARVALRDVLARPGPVLVQFIFTTCGTICPVLTQTAAAVQREVPGLAVVSISIDPDEDTPERLAGYAQRHGARDGWHFLTGSPEDSIAAQQAFGAHAGSKMRHLPLSFLRAAPTRDWLRVEGAFTAADLVAEFRRLSPGDAALGRKLYRDGVLASGKSVTAQGPGGIAIEGAAAACAGCHRRSGYGGIEGRAHVPPITASSLFAAPEPRRVDRFRALFQEQLAPDVLARLRASSARPAYSAATFAQALSEGRASDGRALDALMPRYALSESDRANLAAYLATLGESSAGVDAHELHFATIVSDAVPPAKRDAMLAVMRAWLARRNADNARRDARPPNPMGYEDDLPDANRAWTLDVWTLSGEPGGWRVQLDAYQRRRPVFAVLGGLGDWTAAHAFCEANRIPCVLSLTDAPVSEDGDYTSYLSGGLPLEARALARHLAAAWPSLGAARLVQIAGDAEGEGAAAALQAALAGSGVPSPVDAVSASDAASVAVLWLDEAALRGESDNLEKRGFRRIYVSRARAGDAVASWPPALRAKTVLIDRLASADDALPQAYRARAWLRSHGAAGDEQDVRLATYYLMSLTESSVAQLLDHHSRELLIEAIERDAEDVPNPGPYPSLSLGPGQRVAAKRCRLVHYAGDALEPWTAP
ncbi:MAG TPA: SCO family protein [Tahibacter sp.]|uniref:SCO family protein n=1 Tax=Tahibacter sp. TaxID=2056211 RepID=UPI002D0311D0|nr:SCO family protein [Tahibacter sp.]HSX62295.1 SCO family protein [Tahibacter sp.]